LRFCLVPDTLAAMSSEDRRMTEAEWLAYADPKPMLDFLGRQASNRKLRLFACACCRTQWDLIEEEDVRKAIDAAERYADGLIRDSTVTNWYRCAARARDRLPQSGAGRVMLYQAVVEAALPDQHRGRVAQAYTYVAAAVAHQTASPRVPDWEATWGAARAAAVATFPPLLREVIGNPFRTITISPAWLTPNVTTLAQAAYDERLATGLLDPDRLAVLGDALEDTGCTDAELLAHFHGPSPHFRGCWALDLLLGRS
jgi:hypothetical protein